MPMSLAPIIAASFGLGALVNSALALTLVNQKKRQIKALQENNESLFIAIQTFSEVCSPEQNAEALEKMKFNWIAKRF